MDSNLTIEEMEREAYQRGEIERAALLRLALDGEGDKRGELEHEAEYERERAADLELQLDQFLVSMRKHLVRIEDAVESGDKAEIAAAIAAARKEL